jgi:hypothetical protein
MSTKGEARLNRIELTVFCVIVVVASSVAAAWMGLSAVSAVILFLVLWSAFTLILTIAGRGRNK